MSCRHHLGTRVQSSGGFWFSQDIPYTIPGDGTTTTATEAHVQTCSVVEDGKYGCIEQYRLALETITTAWTFTNTAIDRVFTDVGERKTDNNAAVGSMATMAWQMISVSGAMIVGALVAV